MIDKRLAIVTGASGGLDAIMRLFTSPGDTVLVEAPSYHEALALIRDYPVYLAAALTMAAHPSSPDLNQLDSQAPWYTNTATSRASEATQVGGEHLFGIMIDAWVMAISDLYLQI